MHLGNSLPHCILLFSSAAQVGMQISSAPETSRALPCITIRSCDRRACSFRENNERQQEFEKQCHKRRPIPEFKMDEVNINPLLGFLFGGKFIYIASRSMYQTSKHTNNVKRLWRPQLATPCHSFEKYARLLCACARHIPQHA
jgi:hypothetical protein